MFTLPENLSELSAKDLAALREDAIARQKVLSGLKDDELTDPQVDELESIPAFLEGITTQETALTEAETTRAQRIAAAREKNAAPAAEKTDPEKPAEDAPADDDPEGDKEPGDEPSDEDPEAAIDVPNDARELTEIKEPVMASAAQRAAQHTAPVKVPDAPKAPELSFRAGTDINGQIRMGQDLGGFAGLANAFGQRAQTIPKGAGLTRTAVGAIEKPHSNAFHLDATLAPERNSEMLYSAANEQSVVRREDGTFGLEVENPREAIVAAGGFFHPPVVNYDLPVLETEGQGDLVLPTVTMDRGSYRYTRGIDFDDIYADTGFALTEEQVIADTPKHMTEITAPEFEDVKLDLIGYGLRVGFLTAKTWPELITRYLAGVKTAHAHKKNATIIARVATALGTAHTAGDHGSVVVDSLDALSIAATRLRYKYRLPINAVIEGMAPLWVLDVFKTDLAYQTGVDTKAITQAQVESWLAARNISLQWVYDWQDLSGTFAAGALVDRPATANVGLWVKGTFVKGELDIVSLDMIYDTASLVVNTYTAAFFEEAISVFSPQGSGVMVTLPLASHYGRIGADDITNKTAA